MLKKSSVAICTLALISTPLSNCMAVFTGNIDKGTPVDNITPLTFRLTGGAQADTYNVQVRKITGYNSNGPIYGSEDVYLLEEVIVNMGGHDVYTGEKKLVDDVYATNSGDYRAWFRKVTGDPNSPYLILDEELVSP